MLPVLVRMISYLLINAKVFEARARGRDRSGKPEVRWLA